MPSKAKRITGYVLTALVGLFLIGASGVPKFVDFPGKKEMFGHLGITPELAPVLGVIAMANSGDLQIELIQQRNDVPSLYREFAAKHGEGLQHMSWWSTTYQADFDAALARGLTIGHEGQINGPNGRFVYFDTDQAHPGTVVELSDVSGTKMRFFDHIRRAAVDWDGSDPIRPVK